MDDRRWARVNGGRDRREVNGRRRMVGMVMGVRHKMFLVWSVILERSRTKRGCLGWSIVGNIEEWTREGSEQ